MKVDYEAIAGAHAKGSRRRALLAAVTDDGDPGVGPHVRCAATKDSACPVHGKECRSVWCSYAPLTGGRPFECALLAGDGHLIHETAGGGVRWSQEVAPRRLR